MQILRLYGRVLSLLGSESKLAWILALANLALATAQFAEPVLLGRIIDTLTGAQARGDVPQWSNWQCCSPPGPASAFSPSHAER